MRYIQALMVALKRGADPAVFSPLMVQEMEKIRSEMAPGSLKIEPFDKVSERIIELGDGRKVVRYYGRYIHGFESYDGQLQLEPGGKNVDRERATEVGNMVFLVDSSGKVTGWYDELTGNMYGERVPKSGPGETNSLLLALPWIAICALLILGVFYVLRIIG